MLITKEILKKLSSEFKINLNDAEFDAFVDEQNKVLDKMQMLVEFDSIAAKQNTMLLPWPGVVSPGTKGALNSNPLKTVPFVQDTYIVIPKIL